VLKHGHIYESAFWEIIPAGPSISAESGANATLMMALNDVHLIEESRSSITVSPQPKTETTLTAKLTSTRQSKSWSQQKSSSSTEEILEETTKLL
jgi:hypothetical protein